MINLIIKLFYLLKNFFNKPNFINKKAFFRNFSILFIIIYYNKLQILDKNHW